MYHYEPLFDLDLEAVVDSLKTSEIVVSFSCLSRWPDPPPPPSKEESKLDLKSGGGKAGKGDKSAADKESRMEAMTAESSSLLDSKYLESRSTAVSFFVMTSPCCSLPSNVISIM